MQQALYGVAEVAKSGGERDDCEAALSSISPLTETPPSVPSSVVSVIAMDNNGSLDDDF